MIVYTSHLIQIASSPLWAYNVIKRACINKAPSAILIISTTMYGYCYTHFETILHHISYSITGDIRTAARPGLLSLPCSLHPHGTIFLSHGP